MGRRALKIMKAMKAMNKNIKSIMSPKSIAVVGATNRPGSVGLAVFRNILTAGFQGVLYPVNPKARYVQSVKAYPKLEDIPDEVIVDIDDDEISLDFLLNLIQSLPDRYRMVFNLYVLDGHSHKEISKMLQIAEGTSKSNLHDARTIMKNKISTLEKERHSG